MKAKAKRFSNRDTDAIFASTPPPPADATAKSTVEWKKSIATLRKQELAQVAETQEHAKNQSLQKGLVQSNERRTVEND
jgi:hypothetical protein